MLKGFVLGVILAVVIMAGGFYGYFALGIAPVATAAAPMPFERKLAHAAMRARFEKQPEVQSPVAADESTYLAGADVYKQHCAACHGLPQNPSGYVKMMYPRPPQLFHGMGVTDDTPYETYWKAANGIRMTGMPAFKTVLTDTQLWQVSELLAHANEISDPVKKALVPDTVTGAQAPGAATN